jgi:hypothetical protein
MRAVVSRTPCDAGPPDRKRRGNIVVLGAAMLVMIFGFAAFSVDVGFLTVTKAQIQAAAAAAALAACMELPEGLGMGATLMPHQVEALAGQAAVEVAALHRAGDRDVVHVDAQRDLRFGQAVWDPATQSWARTWGVAPYNMVEVTVRRDQEVGAADGPVRLFFAPIIGHRHSNLTVRATAALLPGSGFRLEPGQRAGVLPFAFDEQSWDQMAAGEIADDNFAYDPETGAIGPGSDGIPELDMFPAGKGELPPGNRGTVNIGTANNSTSTVIDQILNGLSKEHLDFHGGELSATSDDPLDVGGNTGISAAMRTALESIKGRPSAMPVFRDVHGPGNNAVFTLVGFVGVRIVDVKLTGNPKHVLIQPAPYVHSSVVPDTSESAGPGGTLNYNTVFTTPRLIQ